MYLPLIGRLSLPEYLAVLCGFVFIVVESLLRIIILFLPNALIQWFHDRSRELFIKFVAPPRPKTKERELNDRIRTAQDFGELCRIFGYTFEEHVVLTKDGYLLGLHRLPSKKGQKKSHPGTSTGRPVAFD
jgi:lysosomal acid lipase/cholesteryl ester hydrolase